MKKVKKRRIKKSIKLFFAFVLVVIISFFLYTYLNRETEETNNQNTEVEEIVTKPVWNTNDEILNNENNTTLDKIRYVASIDKRLEIVRDNYDKYPEILLKMLIRNPDMTEYVLGYLENYGIVTSDTIGYVFKGITPVIFQYDTRWGYGTYGDSTIAITGCGPTALSMVIASLTGQNTYTPYVISKFAEEKGYYSSVGTSWDLMTKGVLEFGIIGKEIPLSKNIIYKELENGHPIICSMKPGDFTTTGHFIVLTGIKDGKIKVNDSNSRERSAKLWDYETIEYQIKNLWSFELSN